MSAKVVFFLTVDQASALRQLAKGKRPSPWSNRVMESLRAKGLTTGRLYEPELSPLGEAAAAVAARLALPGGYA